MKLETGKLYVVKKLLSLKWAELEPGEVLMIIKEAESTDHQGLTLYRDGLLSAFTTTCVFNKVPEEYLTEAPIKRITP